MAFTAVQYPTDKDRGQLPFWPDGDELGVASENFFDQFVTFDGSDPTAMGNSGSLLDAPPSPSILLDSLNDGLTTSSSSDQDRRSGQSESESSATSASLDIPSLPSSQAASSELSKSVPVELPVPPVDDPVLSGGSISDSELLRLEGISLKSPKPNATAPSSPHFASTSSPSPRKHSRVLDSIYATIRRATHRPRSHKHQNPSIEADPMATMDTQRREEGNTCYDMPASFDLNDFTDIKLEGTPGPVDSHGMPLSPPNTGRIPPDQHLDNVMNFVSGHFDDPFCDGLLAPPAVIKPAAKTHKIDANLDTPLLTPAMNDDTFYQHTIDLMDGSNSSFRPQPQPKQRSTSSAEWPMEGILTNDSHSSNLWSASSPPGVETAYVPDSGTSITSADWWDPPQQANGRHHHSGHSHHSRLHNNASLSLAMHNQQADLPFDYSANGDLSGLMIHMPQPRAPQAAVLSSNINDSLMSSPPSSGYYPAPHQGGHRHMSSSASSSSSSHYHRDSRRPRPRAPSSGARHYSGPYGGSMTSPRKTSSGAACYTLREESMSPTPGPRHRSSSSSLSSLTVRKRRSWTRRHQQHPGSEPRTPTATRSSSRRSVSYEPSSARRGSASSGGGGSSVGGGGGGFSIEFCNYTPSDKKVLMNGVAPSGSSKTKARREREARENERKMSEAYMQMLRAAGGDMDKLRQTGFFADE